MRRTVEFRTAALTTLAAGAALALGAATAGAVIAPVSGHVAPRSGSPHATFTVTFTTPVSTGIKGKLVTFEDVQATNTNTATYQKKTCLSSFQVDAGYGAAGSKVSASTRPATRWCAGRWAVQVLELTAPACYAERTCASTGFHELGSFTITKRFFTVT
jgi:hypothetical protein